MKHKINNSGDCSTTSKTFESCFITEEQFLRYRSMPKQLLSYRRDIKDMEIRTSTVNPSYRNLTNNK